MIHPYQLHSLSKLYREEALQEARRRHIIERARTHRAHASQDGWSSFGGTRWHCCGERTPQNSTSSLSRKDAK
jgi:hypothetical protein